MTISNEAVEALRDAAHDSGFVLKRSDAHDWLEAAAPIIRAEALEDAADSTDADDMFAFGWKDRQALRARAVAERGGQ